MNTDPTINGVVFKLKSWWGKESFHTEGAPTQAPDGIKQAWLAIQRKTGAKPSQVEQIMSEWAPGEEDAVFLNAVLPRAAVFFTFPRPAADGWTQALADAARHLRASAARDEGELTYTKFKETKERRQRGETRPFPVLRHYQPDDMYADSVVHRQIGPGLAVFLAYTTLTPTPEDIIGLDYVMKISAGTPEAIAALFETAWQNLRTGLQVDVSENDGGKVLFLTHPSDMGASALGLPEFYQQMRERLGGDELFVAFADPASLCVTLPNTPAVDKIRSSVARSNYAGPVTLIPSCYLMDSRGVHHLPPPLPLANDQPDQLPPPLPPA